MIVHIPGLLRSYTANVATVPIAVAELSDVRNPSVDSALKELDRRFPGLRFRIVDEQAMVRPHIRLFLDGIQVRDLAQPLTDAAALLIVGALSGG